MPITLLLSTHTPNRIFRPSYGPVMEYAICMDLKIADRYTHFPMGLLRD